MPTLTNAKRKRGRPRAADPAQRMRQGIFFMARIPRPLHRRMKEVAESQGIALGRWIVEQAAAAIGETIVAPRQSLSKKKSAA